MFRHLYGPIGRCVSLEGHVLRGDSKRGFVDPAGEAVQTV